MSRRYTISIFILGLILGLFFIPNPWAEPDRLKIETMGTIAKVELALESYRIKFGKYPFTEIPEYDLSNEHSIPLINELKKFEDIEYPIQDRWGNSIYIIPSKFYPGSSKARKKSNSLYYNARTFQIISFGPDGTETPEDNVCNFVET